MAKASGKGVSAQHPWNPFAENVRPEQPITARAMHAPLAVKKLKGWSIEAAATFMMCAASARGSGSTVVTVATGKPGGGWQLKLEKWLKKL